MVIFFGPTYPISPNVYIYTFTSKPAFANFKLITRRINYISDMAAGFFVYKVRGAKNYSTLYAKKKGVNDTGLEPFASNFIVEHVSIDG